MAEDELPALYRSATAFVYPSLYEGFGLPVIEAMACGTPVLTSRVSALPELAEGAAVLVDPSNEAALAEAMHALATDRALRERLREAGPRAPRSTPGTDLRPHDRGVPGSG